MQFNHLQSNNTHNASFAPNPAAANQPQQGAHPQVRVLPPLAIAADLASNPSARNLQAYNTISTPQGPTDNWNAPEYQPVKPGLPYMEKLPDEANKTKVVDILLKHAQEKEELGDLLGDFKQAEEAHENLLKYTENPEHYKLYATCLQKASTALKDATKANVYKEKAARAFYYLGDLYQKQGALQDAQAAYKASCDLALYEAPLKALVDVARHLGEASELAAALEKLADFYAQKGDTASAIQMLDEALQVEQSPTLLKKLAALHGQAGGEDNQLKAYETRTSLFEMQVKKNPENIGAYREHAWFLKDIGRKDEARAVKKRMDDIFQQKLLKKKAKIAGLKETIHFKDEKLEVLEKQLQGSATGTKAAIAELKQEQANSIRTLATGFNTQLETLKVQVQANATATKAAIADLKEQQEKSILTLNTKLNKLDTTLSTQLETLKVQVQANASKNDTAIDDLKKKLVSLENIKLSQQVKNLNKLEAELYTLNGKIDTLSQQVAAKNETIHRMRQQVTTLNFSGKSSMTDQDLIKELDENPQVEILNLQGCANLTDAVLCVIPDKCKKLRELNLTGCPGTIEDGVIHVLDHSPQLKLVNLTDCPLSNSYKLEGKMGHYPNVRFIRRWHGALIF